MYDIGSKLLNGIKEYVCNTLAYIEKGRGDSKHFKKDSTEKQGCASYLLGF